MQTRTTIVVPCYNEAQRLPVKQLGAFLQRHLWASLWLVNDGSSDATQGLLDWLAQKHAGRLRVLELSRNQGKAEAVRLGLLAAADHGDDYLGYWDADLATPLEELPRFREVLDRRPEIHLVAGVRLPLLGRDVRRQRFRQLLGRSFARCAGWTLQLPVADTQCGAKLFRWTPAVASVFSAPFLSRWIFDVEILARWPALVGRQHESIYELPLEHWRDVAGSKLRPRDFVRAAGELVRLGWQYRLRAAGAAIEGEAEIAQPLSQRETGPNRRAA